MRLIRTLGIIAILIVLISGCGHDNNTLSQNQAYPNIQLLFAPALGQQVEITRVVVLVTAPDIEPMEFELEVEGRKASGTIAVPSGAERTFKLEAYSADDVEYEAEKTVEVLEPGSDFSLELRLERVKFTIGIAPSEINTSEGDTFEARIMVEHLKGLFGFTFELEYDENLLEPVEVEKGEFLDDDVLFLSQIEPGRLSVGATRKAGAGEANGSGVIARIYFRAIAPGEMELKFARNDTLAFRKEDGTNVDGFEERVIKDAKVTIE